MQGTGRKRKIRLGGFTRSSLEEQATRRGVEVGALLHQALVYYTADRDNGRAGWRLPRFATENGTATEISVELSERSWEILEEEAQAQSADEDRLLEHVALYYLSDLAAGRIAARIVRSLGDEPEGAA